MIKNMDKKSLRLLIIVISIPLFLLFLLFIVKGCSSGDIYKEYQDKMISAAEKYFINNNKLPVTEGGTVTVTLEDLVKEGLITTPSKKLDDESCSGSVSVRNNGVSVEENKGGFYLFIPDLECSKYKTKHLIDKLKKDVVTEKSGLYQVNDGYIYKGLKVKNYVKFNGKLFRIISIDNNNIIKMIKIDSEEDYYIWDNKYNVESESNDGKNDYSDSVIVDSLLELYKKYDKNVKKHLIGYNVCYGNRSESYLEKDKISECSKRLDNQFLSLMNTYDFSFASYDNDCIYYNSPSCENYNYLYESISDTWLLNGTADDSYNVYYYSYGYFSLDLAVFDKTINLVVYIDGEELFEKGNGTFKNPYVISVDN